MSHYREFKVKSTSVDKDKTNGPNFYGSYVEHIIKYPSGCPLREISSETSFQGTNLVPSLFKTASLEGSTFAG